MNLWSSRPRRPFLGLAVGAVVGVAVADWWTMPLWVVLGALAVCGLVALRWPRAWLCWVCTALAFAALHTVRFHNDPGQEINRELEQGRQVATVTGVVVTEPEVTPSTRGEVRSRFRLKIESLAISDQPRQGEACMVRWLGAPPLYGDRVSVRGSAEPLLRPFNPGEFDSAAWQARQGVHFQLTASFADDCHVTGHGAGAWHQYFAIAARSWVKQRLEYALEDAPDVTALIESMVLGMRGETPPEMKELFQKTGTLHLFAVSGLNVAMLAAIAWYLLKPFRVSRAASAVIIIPLLIAYAVATGLSASCVRATLMASFILAAWLVDRPAVPVNSIAASALVILAFDTNQLFSPGFQFSFVLVLVIIALALPIQRKLEPWAAPDDFLPKQLYSTAQKTRVKVWGLVAAATGVTLAAWVGSLFFTAGYFHLFSFASIPANLIAVPIAFCVLALGLATLLGSLASMGLAAVFNHANWGCAKLLLLVVDLFARLPGGHVYVELPHLRPAPLCEVNVLSVSDGAALHVRADGRDWLIDCGSARNYPRTLLPYLRSRGVNRLDGLVLSHGDTAHVGSATVLLQDFQPRWIAETPFADRSPSRRGLHLALSEQQRGKRFLVRGDTLSLTGDVILRVLYPPADLVSSSADDKALVVMIEAGQERVLFTSDAGFRTEQWLLTHEPDLHADFLVRGWPSRDLSGTPDFFSAVNPRAVINAGMSFGTPPEKGDAVLAPLIARGVTVFRQDDSGAVRIQLQRDGRFQAEAFHSHATLHSTDPPTAADPAVTTPEVERADEGE